MLKQFYCSKKTCDPIEYTLKGADIEPACLTFAQARRQLHARPKNSSLASPYCVSFSDQAFLVVVKPHSDYHEVSLNPVRVLKNMFYYDINSWQCIEQLI